MSSITCWSLSHRPLLKSHTHAHMLVCGCLIPVLLDAVHALNKLPYSKLDSKAVGIKDGVVFLTYSSLIASSEKGRSRLQQLVQWCGSDFDGLIVFDEVRDINIQCSFTSSEKGHSRIIVWAWFVMLWWFLLFFCILFIHDSVTRLKI